MGEEIKTEKQLLIDSKCHLYTRRWAMLVIFMCLQLSDGMMWMQYAAISSEVEEYFDAPSAIIDTFGAIYFITYVFFIFPALYILEKTDIKTITIIGGGLHMAGSWIRYIGILQHSVSLSILGQAFSGVAQTCCFGISTHFAGAWFGSNEVSLASGLGFTAFQFGTAVAFILPNQLLNLQNQTEIKLKYYFLGTAIFISIIFLIICFFFEAKPLSPPSYQKNNSTIGKQDSFWKSLKVILMNLNFVLLLLACGICIGLSAVIMVKINYIILSVFPEKGYIIGTVVLVTMIGFGSVFAGWVLDKTKQFLLTTRVTVLLTFLTLGCFVFSIKYEQILLACVSFGLYFNFSRALLTIGAETAAEQTYPESESLSASLIILCIDITGFVVVYVYDALDKLHGVDVANFMILIVCAVAAFLTILIKRDDRRHQADEELYLYDE
ncbi:uncharacterized MFS-type transporter C09D4.1-like [Antedon mediterranea]|uniref:uncharacterized MFS-type transporter C09D4.1-like n=1 Tax=Antedon mediterranea TaxID=105859 RepID=UPI003AF91B6B